jgi:hypothetical protein
MLLKTLATSHSLSASPGWPWRRNVHGSETFVRAAHQKTVAQTLNAKIHALTPFPSPLMDYTRKWTADIVAANK